MPAKVPPRAYPSDTRPVRRDWVLKQFRLANGELRKEYYDFRRRLQLVIEPDGSELRFHYSPQGTLTDVEHSSGARVRYERNEETALRAITARTDTSIQVDHRGYPTHVTLSVDNHTWTVGYSRDDRGLVLSCLYPQSSDWLHTSAKEFQCGDLVYLRFESEEHNDRVTVCYSNGTRSVEEVRKIKPPRLVRHTHYDAAGSACVDMSYETDESGRLTKAGDESFSYDSSGPLESSCSTAYAYDAQRNLAEIRRAGGTTRLSYGGPPAVAGMTDPDGRTSAFEYDTLGRRAAKAEAGNGTRYTYDLLGQLETVEGSDGTCIRYIYDGFGRLVGRESGREIRYYILDLDGKRLAEADKSGRITRSYIWVGGQCVAKVDGPIGAPIAESYHRLFGGRLAGIGDSSGHIRAVRCQDPYGADVTIEDGLPGFACLFGDPATGLLHAGSRWFDPATAQFTTPDSWIATDSLNHLTGPFARILRATPGGTGHFPEGSVYAWCGYDPINFIDPTGHNFLGLVWAFISAFLWEMQLTSLSLQMEVINLIWEVIQWFPLFRPAWDWDGYWQTSIANGNLPLASYRLMVPFALPLNGLLRAHDRGWTLGSVIWVRGDKWRTVDRTSKRDLLIAGNASQYVASLEEAGADSYRVRSPHAIGTATVNATGDQLTGAAVTTPPGGVAAATVFRTRDWVSIKLAGAGTDETREITGNPSAGVYDLHAPPLPGTFFNQPVSISRLDTSIVKLEKDGTSIARTVTFVRGEAVHFAAQIPEAFATDGLTVTEFMPAGVPKIGTADAPREARIVRLPSTTGFTLYAAADFVRIKSGQNYFARSLERTRAPKDLVLTDPLPVPTPPATYNTIEVVKMNPDGAAIAGQAAAGKRVDVATRTDLRQRDGLTIENTGGAPVVTERRIVIELFDRCTVAALPAALHAVPVVVHKMTADTSVQARGTVTSSTEITTNAGEATRFSVGQHVRIRKAPLTDAVANVSTIDPATNVITLDEPLPAAFAATNPVTVNPLTEGRKFEADNVPAPGTAVTVKVELPLDLRQDDLIRVRLAAAATGGTVRQVAAAPTVVAEVDSPLPATHTAGLSVQRFAPANATLNAAASAPMFQMRITLIGGANPFTVGETIYLSRNEEFCGVVHAINGMELMLRDPIEFVLRATGVAVMSITVTGLTSTGANLDEARVLIPSDPEEEPLTRREAFEHHEMRHVWQGAVWGPFLLSLPIPWLINLGLSFSDSAHGGSQIMRHISVGGLDSLFACVAWGIGAAAGVTSSADLDGQVTESNRKVVTFPAAADPAKVEALSEGSPITVSKSGFDSFNVVETLNTGEKKITMRFELEGDKFAVGDTVKVSVSAFDKIRKQVNTWFSLNLEQLWSNHIPAPWGRALSKFLNRDSWFPGLGIYPLSLMVAGGDEDRLPNEQDAAFHSGDLYTTIALGRPNEIFVGQFSRLFAFLHPRGAGDVVEGISDINPLDFLKVDLPGGVTFTDIAGGIDAGGSQVRFKRNYYLPLTDKVENAVAVFFAASKTGDYLLRAPGELPANKQLVFTFAFDVDFVELKTIHVRALGVTPAFTAADPMFETEDVRFQIAGDSTAEYRIRYRVPAAPAGAIDGLRFTAPVLPGAAAVPHNLEITATYPANHPVFRGPGQLNRDNLAPEERTNLCQELNITIAPLTAPVIPAVAAGSTTNFNMPIAPRAVTVTSALPAGAAVNARVINGTGRPAQLTFVAPNAVSAATAVTFDMFFGTGASQKTVSASVTVNP